MSSWQWAFAPLSLSKTWSEAFGAAAAKCSACFRGVGPSPALTSPRAGMARDFSRSSGYTTGSRPVRRRTNGSTALPVMGPGRMRATAATQSEMWLGFILCISTRWAGDSTTPFVADLTRSLVDRGWKADVLAPHAPGAARDEELAGIPVHRFRYLRPERAQTVCYQGGALVNLRQNRSNLLKLPALVGAEWATVVRRLRTGAYDAVHAHWVLPQGLVGVLATRTVPVVVTVHGGDVFALDQGPLRAAKRFAFGRAAAVTVNSSATERAVSATRVACTSAAASPPLNCDLTQSRLNCSRIQTWPNSTARCGRSRRGFPLRGCPITTRRSRCPVASAHRC